MNNQNLVFEKLTAVLAVNVPADYRIEANYFRITDAVSPVSVTLYKADRGIGTAVGMQAGEYVKDIDFDRISITSATAQNVTFMLLSGAAGSDRLTGSVTLGNTSGAFTQGNAAALGFVSALLAAANPARRYLLIQNNDTSGNVYVTLDGSAADSVHGLKIVPGATLELQGYVTTSAVNAIGDTASNGKIIVVEG